MVTPADMQFLSEAFGGAMASSMYACTEHMMLGMSNPGGETMTLIDDNLDIRIPRRSFDHHQSFQLHPAADPLSHVRHSAPGQRTGLTLYRDSESWWGARSKCRCSSIARAPRTSSVRTPSTKYSCHGVTRFQMQITGPASFIFPICVDAALDEPARAAAAAGDPRAPQGNSGSKKGWAMWRSRCRSSRRSRSMSARANSSSSRIGCPARPEGKGQRS